MKKPRKRTPRTEATHKQLDAYRMVYVLGMSHRRAATVLKISQQAVTQRLNRLFDSGLI